MITAVEESDGRDSSVVRRPIEIVSNPRHSQTCISVHRVDLIALGCMKLARCSYHSYLIIIVPSYL